MSKNNESVRIGLMSRLDFGSKGSREGLWELAAEVFQRSDINLAILAGGLVAGKTVEKRRVHLRREIRKADRGYKNCDKEITANFKKIDHPKTHPSTRKKLVRENDELMEQRKAFEQEKKDLSEELLTLEPQAMAKALAESLPRFKNAKGEQVKLWIITSPAFDKSIGREVAELLGESTDREYVRVLGHGDDYMPLWDGAKELQLLTPRTMGFRGEYYSTQAEALIRRKSKQSSRPHTSDVQIVGCFGVSINKPKGEFSIPYVTVPTLRRIEDQDGRENQTGVLVMDVFRDRVHPDVKNYDFKGLVARERSFIGSPGKLAKSERDAGKTRKLLDLLRKKGAMSTGDLAEAMGHPKARGYSKKTIRRLLAAHVPTEKSRTRQTWPGLEYDENSDRWDFRLSWVQKYLRYPVPTDEGTHEDSLVAFGCLHCGSIDTDYEHFKRDIPRVILEKNAKFLVGCGDFVEGLGHDMLKRRQVYAGLNETEQQKWVGALIAKVMLTVFEVRFNEQIENGPKRLRPDRVAEMIRESLVTFLWAPGNHDHWINRAGVSELTTMVSTMVESLTEAIEDMLFERGLFVHKLSRLIKAKIIKIMPDETYTLPSGLTMGIMHPHMSRTKTTSIRPQSALGFKKDCQLVFIANFHVGEVINEWTGSLGQRKCVMVGTLKHGSPFENNKMKTVDQGFAWTRVISVDGVIRDTEDTFYTNDKAVQKKLDIDKPFRDKMSELDIQLPN